MKFSNQLRTRTFIVFAVLFAVLLGGVLPAIAQRSLELRIAPVNPAYENYISGRSPGSLNAASASERNLGWIPSPLDLSPLRGARVLGAYRPAAGLPATFDLRTMGKLPAVRDQGNCGSCWSFATAGSLESGLMPVEQFDFSENNMKNTIGWDWECCAGGNLNMAAAYLTRWSGPVLESADPYNAGSCSSPPGLQAKKHVQEVVWIPSRSGPSDNDSIKQAIMDHGAVYISIWWDDASYNDPTYSYYYDGSEIGNHAICVVGWDDNYDKSKFKTPPPGNGAFIIRNSWGAGWGEGGYFYISYYDSALGEEIGYIKASSVDNYSTIYQYDPLGWVNSLGFGNTTVWFANVFTAPANDFITAVGWYTASPDSTYEISGYLDPTTGPASGTQVVHQTGTVANSGYKTIELQSLIPVAKSQKFSIVVKLTTPGFNYPAPFEAPYAGVTSGARANKGESFISGDGSKWYDLAAELPNSNVCLKAYGMPASKVPPVVQLDTPSDPLTYTNDTTVDLIGTATDNRSVVAVTWANAATGKSGNCMGTASWQALGVGLKLGENLITVSATDGDGNTGTVSITIVCDIAPPTISINSPTSDSTYITNNDKLTLGGTASDNFGIASINWSNGNNGAHGTCATTTKWTAENLDMSIGDNQITFTATDKAGNSSTAKIVVTYFHDLRVAPSRVGLLAGAQQQFQVVGGDKLGNLYKFDKPVVWQTTTGDINENGLLTVGEAPGTVKVGFANYAANVDVSVFNSTPQGGYVLERWWGGSLGKPTGVAAFLNKQLYAIDTDGSHIQMYDTLGSYETQFGSFGAGEGQFNLPRDVAVDESGEHVYTTDVGNNRVAVFLSNGSFAHFFGKAGTGDGELSSPHGIVVSPDGKVYVADAGNHRIQVFDLDGKYLFQWGRKGSGEGEFVWPRDVALDAAGNVYVADTYNYRVQKFDAAGKFIVMWGTEGTREGQFSRASGLAIDGDGNVFVADQFNHRIQRFDSTGKFLSQWGTMGDGTGQFDAPFSVGVDSDGSVYVADTYNNRLQKFVKSVLPDVKITSPTADESYWTNTGTIDIAGTASGLLSGISWQNLRTSATGACSGTISWKATGISIVPGENKIVVTAHDAGGNTAQDTLIVYRAADSHAVALAIQSSAATVDSGGAVACVASAADSSGHAVVYAWSDGGANGVFTPSASAQNPTYNAPVITGDDDLSITLTCSAQCAESSLVNALQSVGLTVRAPHSIAIVDGPSLSAVAVGSGENVSCSVAAVDSKGHQMSYEWTADLPGGSFSPSSTVPNPTYKAPTNATGRDMNINIACAVSCMGSVNTKSAKSVLLTVSDPAPTVRIVSPTEGNEISRIGPMLAIGGEASSDTTRIAWINGVTGAAGDCTGTKSWTATVPLGSGLNLITVTAYDAGGKTATDSLAVNHYDDTPGAAWKGMCMVAAPFIPDVTDPKPVVGFDRNCWIAYKPGISDYVSYGNDAGHYTWFDPVASAPGRGFWTFFAGDVPAPCGTVPPQDVPVVIHLYKGWNIVGQPFLKPVSWNLSAIMVQAGAFKKPLAESVGIMQVYAWGWRQNPDDPTKGEYYLVHDPVIVPGATSELAPWRAYWMKAFQDCDLVLPAP